MPFLTRAGLRLPLIVGIAAFASGCVLPEHLDAVITIKGYRFDVALEGRLAEPYTIAALANGEKIPASHEEKMKAQEALALKMPGMKRFEYVGHGRYDFEMKLQGELTDAVPVTGFPHGKSGSSNFLTIRRGKDGTVLVSSPEVSPKALSDLEAIGLGSSGTVSIAFEGSMLESTADDQSQKGLHRWNRTTWKDRVFLRSDPNRPE